MTRSYSLWRARRVRNDPILHSRAEGARVLETLERRRGRSYVVRDANGQALAYVYSRATETDAMQAKALTDDEGRRIAINIARLPELLGHKE
jgi:hypothetical protein